MKVYEIWLKRYEPFVFYSGQDGVMYNVCDTEHLYPPTYSCWSPSIGHYKEQNPSIIDKIIVPVIKMKMDHWKAYVETNLKPLIEQSMHQYTDNGYNILIAIKKIENDMCEVGLFATYKTITTIYSEEFQKKADSILNMKAFW